ncbi:MAG TPA: hypothetical protein VIY26_09505 [Acidimicrobiales bacterium]
MTPAVLTDHGVQLDLKEGEVPLPALPSVSREPEPTLSGPGWLRRHRFSAAVIAVYVALGVIAYWPVLSDSSGRLVSQTYGDPSQMVWFFGWTAHALATGHNPFFSFVANVPYGVNTAQLTSMPLLGVLFAPLTLLAGPVVSVNVLFALAMPLSAASGYLVLRRWKIWAPAAALGGLAFGFSPYMVNEGGQHLNLVFLPLVPLIVAAVVELFRRPRHPLRWGAALGGLVTAQYFISSEILALTALMSIFGLLITGVYWAQTKPDELRAVVGPAIRGIGVAVGVSLVLLAYPVWFGFAGPHHYTGPVWPQGPLYNAHLGDFVAPTPRQLVHPVLGATGANLYHDSFLLEGAYLGWGVLAVVAVLLWVCRRSLRVRLVAALGVIAAVLSFGSYAVVNGKNVPFPFLMLSKLPMLADIIPVRFAVATAACVAGVLAFGLDSIHRRGVDGPELVGAPQSANRRAHKALAAVLVVVVITWLPAWPVSTQSAQGLPSAVVGALPAGDPLVLTYPYPLIADDSAMLWQAQAGFPFRLSGVYAMVPQHNGQPGYQAPLLHPYAVQEYFAAEETGASSNYPKPPPHVVMSAEAKEYVVRQHVDAVLVDLSATNAARVGDVFSRALGPPRLTSGGFELWVIGTGRPTQDAGRRT